jgi:heptosyltransferase-2
MACVKGLKNILVRAPNWIGDAIMSLPALDMLKEAYPDARVTVLSKRAPLPVYENNPNVWHIIEYDHTGRHRGLGGRFRLSSAIRGEGFDAVVLFQNAFDAAFLSFVSRIPRRIGYSRDLRGVLLTMPIKITEDPKKTHQTEYYLNIIRRMTDHGQKRRPPLPRLYVTKEEEAWAEAFLRRRGLDPNKLAGVAPSASAGNGPAKTWDRFSAVMKMLYSEYGLTPVIFGGKEDAQACKKAERDLKAEGGINLAGGISLREFFALAARLRVFVTNDSGPMHASAALGTPTVAVFCSTNPLHTGPLGKASVVVKGDIECSPCYKRECRFGHYDCVRLVSPEAVFSACAGLLKATGQAT